MKRLLEKLNSNPISAGCSCAIAQIRHAANRFAPTILTIGLLTTNAHAQRLWTTQFSDAFGWNQSQYGTTIMLGDVNGDGRADVCGRGGAGIYCTLSNGSEFGPTIFAINNFSDAFGWAAGNYYYGSIRLGDVNGDGRADVCGRGGAGIYCGLSNGDGTFAPVRLWTTQFSDAFGWNQSQYGTTIMLGDVNGDGRADVCGRGGAGIYCTLSNGSEFGPTIFAINNFSDAFGWAAGNYYYGSIRLGDVNGDGRADVCGRGGAGIYCGLSNGDGTFAPVRLWTTQFSDAFGWNQSQYGTTIMLGDVNGDGRADVCGRGGAGIYCTLSNGSEFGPTIFAINNFSDAFGWAAGNYYYGSIRLGDVNGDGRADVCGRGGAGVYCGVSTVVFQNKEPQPVPESQSTAEPQPTTKQPD